MKAILYLGILVLLMSNVSAINYFGLENSTNEYSTFEMIEGLGINDNGSIDLNSTDFKPVTRPFTNEEQARLFLIGAVVLGIASLIFISILSYWSFGGRNRP